MKKQVVKQTTNKFVSSDCTGADRCYLVKNLIGEFGVVTREIGLDFIVHAFEGFTSGNNFIPHHARLEGLMEVLLHNEFEVFEYDDFDEMMRDYLDMKESTKNKNKS